MSTSEKIGKTRTSIYIDQDKLDMARKMGVNVSDMANSMLNEMFESEEAVTLAIAKGKLGGWQSVVNKLESKEGDE